MVSNALKQKIDDFINMVNEPYVKVESVSYEEIDKVYNKYVKKIFELSEETRFNVLETIEKSYKANYGHNKIRQWGRLCVGIASLLGKHEHDWIDRKEAVDIVVRLSRWYHTQGNFYLDFISWARKIARTLWGSIENLYYQK